MSRLFAVTWETVRARPSGNSQWASLSRGGSSETLRCQTIAIKGHSSTSPTGTRYVDPQSGIHIRPGTRQCRSGWVNCFYARGVHGGGGRGCAAPVPSVRKLLLATYPGYLAAPMALHFPLFGSCLLACLKARLLLSLSFYPGATLSRY